MTIYFIRFYDYDYCNTWEHDSFHTTNKRQLEDLCMKLNKKYGSSTRSFRVCELDVKNSLSHEDIKQFKMYHFLD